MVAVASESAGIRRFAVPSIMVAASISCITPSCSSPAMRIRSCSCAFINRSLSALISAWCFSTMRSRTRWAPQTSAITRGDREREKPGGLVVGRRDREIEVRAGFVPHAAVVAGDDAEAVIARRQVGVEGLPPIAGVLPIAIVALQHVAEAHLLRCDEAQAPCSRSAGRASAPAGSRGRPHWRRHRMSCGRR